MQNQQRRLQVKLKIYCLELLTSYWRSSGEWWSLCSNANGGRRRSSGKWWSLCSNANGCHRRHPGRGRHCRGCGSSGLKSLCRSDCVSRRRSVHPSEVRSKVEIEEETETYCSRGKGEGVRGRSPPPKKSKKKMSRETYCSAAAAAARVPRPTGVLFKFPLIESGS